MEWEYRTLLVFSKQDFCFLNCTKYKESPFIAYFAIFRYVSPFSCARSQISFWIDYNSIPARTALGITTVLAMTTLLFGVQSSLPSVPYIKAVDLFMIVSFASVFAALVEYAVVNYTSMREKGQKESRPSKNKYTVVSENFPLSKQ